MLKCDDVSYAERILGLLTDLVFWPSEENFNGFVGL